MDLTTYFKAEFAEHHDVARRSEAALAGAFAGLVDLDVVDQAQLDEVETEFRVDDLFERFVDVVWGQCRHNVKCRCGRLMLAR